MLSSDSGSDDEQSVFVPHESIKDVLTIIHKGIPPKEPQPFAIGSNKKAHWPTDLWNSGKLIYSIENPNVNLKPPTARSDRTLRFNSRFESGNLSLVYKLSPDTYHLILEYDKNKTRSCQWFYFQMKNVKKDFKYFFYISGFHKGTSVDHGGLKIFWYSDKRAKKEGISWSRGGFNYEYGVTLRDDSGKRASLQFKISFPYDNDTVYLCYALPYTYSDLQRSILNWKNKNSLIFSSTSLCQTLGGRDCPLLTITSPNNIKENNNNYLFFTARVHPGESNGSFVLHGLIDFLLSDHPAAKYLVDKYIIKIVPMLNIDGVVEGFYRIGLSGVDLNRVWTSPNPTLHPVITSTKKLIKELSLKGHVAVYIDFHGHSRLNGSFAYGCPNNETRNKDEIFLNCDKSLINTEKMLPRIISLLSDAFSWGSCQFSYPKERKAASRIVIRKELGIVQSYTIETSFGGIITGPRAGVLYDELIWKELGSKCGEGVYHFITKSTSPLASYVEKEILMITPLTLTNNIDEVLNDENGQNNELVEVDANNDEVNQSSNQKNNENLFFNFDIDQERKVNNVESNSTSTSKTGKKSKKKSTLTKKKAASSTSNNSQETKTQNATDVKGNTNKNTVSIDEFSRLLNKPANKNLKNIGTSTKANNINNNNNDNDNSNNENNDNNSNTNDNQNDIDVNFLSSDNLIVNSMPKENVTPTETVSHSPKSKKSKEKTNADKTPTPDLSLKPISSVTPAPSQKESHQMKSKVSKKASNKKENENDDHIQSKKEREKEPKQKTSAKPKNDQELVNSNQKINSQHHHHDDEDIELEYLNQRKIRKFGPPSLFKVSKPKNYLSVNSENISSQSQSSNVPKWLKLQFSKR